MSRVKTPHVTALTGEENVIVGVTEKSLNVILQNQITHIVNFAAILVANTFTLASPTVVDVNTFTASSGHSIVVGDILNIFEDSNFDQVSVTNVSANTITIDTPFDTAFTTNASCERGSANMNVLGTPLTPKIFTLKPPSNRIWHITQVSGYLQDASAMTADLFGGITALTNGVVVRVVNAHYRNISNFKSNWQMQAIADIFGYDPKPKASKHALFFKRRMAGQQNIGSAIKVDGTSGDEIQVLIQDDLTGLEQMNLFFHGHVVE